MLRRLLPGLMLLPLLMGAEYLGGKAFESSRSLSGDVYRITLFDRALSPEQCADAAGSAYDEISRVLAKYAAEPAAADALDDEGKRLWDQKQRFLALSGGEPVIVWDELVRAFALDAAAESLLRQGVQSALIEGEGILRCVGSPREAEVWPFAIEHPTVVERAFAALVLDRPATIATAGSYDRLPDPRTGRPTEPNGIASVTVIAKDALTAHAAARSFFRLGLEKGHELIDGLKPEWAGAVCVTEDEAGRVGISITEGMDTKLKDVSL